MGRRSSILLMATLVLGLSLLTNSLIPQTSALQTTPTKISRIISVSNYGLTFITDEITLQEGNSILMGIPLEYTSSIVEYYSTDQGVTVTPFSNTQHPNITFLNITSQDLRERITLVTVLRGAISQDTSGLFNLTFPETPVLLQELQTFNVSILLPGDTEIKTSPAGFNLTTTNQTITLYTEARALDPLITSSLSIYFNSGTIHLLSVTSDEATITFDGEVEIQEKLFVTFEGTGETDTVSLRVPQQSQITLVKGIIEELDTAIGNESQGLVTVAVKLRQAIIGGENASFTIHYKAPIEAFVTTSNGEHTVYFPQSLNTTYNDYKIWIILPSTYTLKEFEPTPQGFIREDPYRTKIMYQRSDTALKTNNNAQLEYERSFSISEYYSWIWGAAILLGAIGLAARLTPLAGPKPAVITLETRKLIEDILEMYSRMNKMRQQVLRGPATQTTEKRGTPLLRETIRTIRRDSERMRDATRKLRKAQPMLTPTLAELQKTEAVIQELLSAYNRVNEDVRRGRVSKKVAERIQKEYNKQTHAQITIEDELIEEMKRSIE